MYIKKEIHMLRILGLIINLGIVIWLGFMLSKYMEPEQITGLNISQNPMILSFVAVVALFIVLKS
jgi:hypothetical protein